MFRAYHGHSVAMIDISPYKFKKLNSKQEYVHVCPCPDTYRGKHRGEDNVEMTKRYTEEFRNTIDEAKSKGKKAKLFINS